VLADVATEAHLVLGEAQLVEASTQLLQVRPALLHMSSPSRLQCRQLRCTLLLLLLTCCQGHLIALLQLLFWELLLAWVQSQHCHVCCCSMPIVCCCWAASELFLCCPEGLKSS
jgi:hypothetical protein